MSEFYINADPSRTEADSSLLLDLVNWYQGELEDIGREDAVSEQAQQTAVLLGEDIARELEAARSKRLGKMMVLNGLVAFLASRGSITVRPKAEDTDTRS